MLARMRGQRGRRSHPGSRNETRRLAVGAGAARNPGAAGMVDENSILDIRVMLLARGAPVRRQVATRRKECAKLC